MNECCLEIRHLLGVDGAIDVGLFGQLSKKKEKRDSNKLDQMNT